MQYVSKCAVGKRTLVLIGLGYNWQIIFVQSLTGFFLLGLCQALNILMCTVT